MRVQRSGLVWAVTLAVNAVCVDAALGQATQAADQSTAEPPGYRAAIDQALAEYAEHNFAEARALFQRAHQLFPNARTLRGLGMMEFELKNYGESVARLEQALASQVKPLDAELRQQTQALLTRAEGFVARYQLALRPSALNARIALDGVPVALDPGGLLTVPMGEHVLLVQASDYQDEKRALSVKGGERQVITIELRATATAPVLATSSVPERRDRSLWTSPWLWTGVGAVVVGGVVTALVLTGGDDSQLEHGDVGGVVMTLRRSR